MFTFLLIVLSIALAAIAGVSTAPTKVDTSLVNQSAPASSVPAFGAPPATSNGAATPVPAPIGQPATNGSVPVQ